MYVAIRGQVALVVSLLVCVCVAQHDETVSPGAKGSGVVEAVCSRLESSCVFLEDKLLTRRLAYVESYDGNHPDTFREGYHGGIWQVDQSMFDKTQDSSAEKVLKQTIQDIKVAFAIDWSAVTWEDLTKPLHSALAARLYLQYQTRDSKEGIPRSIEDQADYWVKYYRPESDPDVFVREAQTLEQGCTNTNGADIVFVLDESGSVGKTNFGKIKNFVKDIITSFSVGKGEDQNRFGVITFSSKVKREFDLNSYFTEKDILKAVDKIGYNGGGTNTHLALDEMTKQAFTEKRGARPKSQGHPRIGIVVTDGQSSKPDSTVLAALRAHDADITVFAVGVGSKINLNELEVIASDPVCLHLMLLDDFEEFESLKYIIEKRTCDAPIVIVPGDNSTIAEQLPAGGWQNCKIRVPEGGITIHIEVSGGRVWFYVAGSTYPSSDYFEDMMEVISGQVGIMYVAKPPTSDAEGLIFCNIKGDNSSNSNISIGGKPGDLDKCRSNPCENGGKCLSNGQGFRCECKPGYKGDLCQTPEGGNPCKEVDCGHGACRETDSESSESDSESDSKDDTADWVCDCQRGYTGRHCETKIDPCSSKPCGKGGFCKVLPDDVYSCKCFPFFTGQHCETKIDVCNPNPCNHGDCSSWLGGHIENGLPGQGLFPDHKLPGNWLPPSIGQLPSHGLPGVGQLPSHGLPDFGQLPSHGLPGVGQLPSHELPSAGQLPSHGIPDVGQLPSHELPEVGQLPSHGSPSAGQLPSHALPDAGQLPADAIPDVGQLPSHELPSSGQLPAVSEDEYPIAEQQPGYTADQLRMRRRYLGSRYRRDVAMTEKFEDWQNVFFGERSKRSTSQHHQRYPYKCHCHTGYTGRHCDTKIDDCSAKPCGPHGECKPLHSGYECCCQPGWTGIHCETSVDECLSNPCAHGECRDKDNGYTCICKPGYTGVNCDIDIDECESNPCSNGDCTDKVNGYECSCLPGWTGKNCDVDIDECSSNPCINGDCRDGQNRYECICAPGWEGPHCDTDIDECSDNPCFHGQCEDLVNGYKCHCPAGWTGKHCDIDIDECTSTPCIHGVCQGQINGFVCLCTPGYTGTHCDEEINECLSEPCQNGGECVDKVNGYQCVCPPGFTGANCDIDIDECDSNPCQNGVCVDQINGYKCHCDAGWTGNICDTDIDECNSSPCVYGDCSNGNNRYDCLCLPGWTGPHCDIDIDECDSNPCYHGDCVDLDNGYECLCTPGWTGRHCDVDIDECESNPCKHGECKNGADHYTCQCKPGYTGVNCETEINECVSNPCVFGECKDKVNSYVCRCDPGYTGKHCDIDIDECTSNPCENGACVDKVNGYECVCDIGWTGTNCDCVIDSCQSNPCVNGVCENGEGYYKCLCDAGYTGKHCETPVDHQTSTTHKPTTHSTTKHTTTTSRVTTTTEDSSEEEGPTYNCDTNNPCLDQENIDNGRFYFPHDDPNKFVQCSEWGECYEMPCPPGLVWDDEAYTCNYP